MRMGVCESVQCHQVHHPPSLSPHATLCVYCTVLPEMYPLHLVVPLPLATPESKTISFTKPLVKVYCRPDPLPDVQSTKVEARLASKVTCALSDRVSLGVLGGAGAAGGQQEGMRR